MYLSSINRIKICNLNINLNKSIIDRGNKESEMIGLETISEDIYSIDNFEDDDKVKDNDSKGNFIINL